MNTLKPWNPSASAVDGAAIRATRQQSTTGKARSVEPVATAPVSYENEFNATADHAARVISERLGQADFRTLTSLHASPPGQLAMRFDAAERVDIFPGLKMPTGGGILAKTLARELMEKGPEGDSVRDELLLFINRRLGPRNLEAVEIAARMGDRIGGVKNPEIFVTFQRPSRTSLTEESFHIAGAAIPRIEQDLMAAASNALGPPPFGDVKLQVGGRETTVENAAAIDISTSLHGVPRNVQRQPRLGADALFQVYLKDPRACGELRAEIDNALSAMPEDRRLRAVAVRAYARDDGKATLTPVLEVIVQDPNWSRSFPAKT